MKSEKAGGRGWRRAGDSPLRFSLERPNDLTGRPGQFGHMDANLLSNRCTPRAAADAFGVSADGMRTAHGVCLLWDS